MVSAQIFIEGGGDGQLHERSFRKAWSEFFRSAGVSGRMPAVVRGGARKPTYDKFAHAVRKPKASKLPVLLVDSEERVTDGDTVWQHLQNRDCWPCPESARDDQAFLMVVTMETWFLADRELLQEHFGLELVESHFKKWPVLENLSKETCSQCASSRYRQMLKPLREREGVIRSLGEAQPRSRRDCMPAREGASGSVAKSVVT